MKAYPITKSELWQLFAIGVLSSIFFSLGMWLLNFGVDIYKDLSINQPIPKETIGYWQNIEARCWEFSGFFFFISLIAMIFGGAKIHEILGQTVFDED